MESKKSVWLEVALNGAAGREYQPLIPITPEEIIQQGVACANAGATVLHTHVFDQHGKPTEDAEVYRRVIEGIRERADIIVYPTLEFAGSAAERFQSILQLSEWGLIDWVVIDPGSVNITHRSQITAGQDGFLYGNPDAHIKHGLELAAEHNWRPAFAIYEPGFIRLGSALAATFALKQAPIYRLMFSDNLLFGTPPTEYALNFYAQMIKHEIGDTAIWMLSGLDADVQHLIEPAVEQGAHIRVGLEDAPFGCQLTNMQLTEQASAIIENSGYRIARPDELT